MWAQGIMHLIGSISFLMGRDTFEDIKLKFSHVFPTSILTDRPLATSAGIFPLIWWMAEMLPIARLLYLLVVIIMVE